MLLPFELDPEIIHHIIYSQAGSIGKALIELLMNSVDAEASAVRLTITKEGFHCTDDGKGFASRADVLSYFGRFGTPHQEGDATYGRFRLGRGQIMAHAKTWWVSNQWQMTVDTRDMGYNYQLDDLEKAAPGCAIKGTWYEPLNDQELMSAIQEVRDLVRYTPVSLELNGRTITRDPASENWDYEDEWAYYRAREEGAVSIYNQGVLVRHDAPHIWGVGGLIVSKQAIGLNVSRTEILRKTCPVWIAIAKQFRKLADEVSNRQGAHRKTEARREKSARSLLSGEGDLAHIYMHEEVITLLPGKHHITLFALLNNARQHKSRITVVQNSNDVPKGEAIARERVIQVIHPQTLQRFGCHCATDFEEVLERAINNVLAAGEQDGNRWLANHYGLHMPHLVAFATLRNAFLERTQIVNDKTALDTETRRAWTALRCCLQHYAGACIGAERYTNGTLRYGQPRMQVLLGESNTAEAWTDGDTYLAIELSIVKRLKTDPLKTAAYIFGLVEHEVAHQGDSLACGHDEAFYQRYHDISINMSPERQRYLHMWLMKYTTSMEATGKKARGKAWSERYLADRVGSGRVKRGLTPLIEDVSEHPLVTEPVPEQSMALQAFLNAGLSQKGACPERPDWNKFIEQAEADQAADSERLRAKRAADEAEFERFDQELAEATEKAKPEVARILAMPLSGIPEDALDYLSHLLATGGDEDDVRCAWECQYGEPDALPEDFDYFTEEDLAEEQARIDQANLEQEAVEQDEDPRHKLDEDCRGLVEPGETWWMLKRNAAVAGFYRVEGYLKWRHTDPAGTH